MRRFAETKNDAIVEIPTIVSVRPVAIEPQPTVVVAFNIEHVRIAIGVRYCALNHP